MKFRNLFAFLLNLPYTFGGLILSLIYIPYKLQWNTQRSSIVIYVKYDRFALLPYMKGWRAMALGHTVILGPREEAKDLEHELIHVDQCARYPLIFPFIYYVELFQQGYRNNRFEREAYARAGNVYRERQNNDDASEV